MLFLVHFRISNLNLHLTKSESLKTSNAFSIFYDLYTSDIHKKKTAHYLSIFANNTTDLALNYNFSIVTLQIKRIFI